MIPPFDSRGLLPPGIHPATLAEIEERFGRQSEVRRVQMESVGWMVDLALRAGVRRIVLNGSFVTAVLEPNDVDCVLLTASDYPCDSRADAQLESGLPFLQIEIVRRKRFNQLVYDFFAKGRHDELKGMVEVVQ